MYEKERGQLKDVNIVVGRWQAEAGRRCKSFPINISTHFATGERRRPNRYNCYILTLSVLRLSHFQRKWEGVRVVEAKENIVAPSGHQANSRL